MVRARDSIWPAPIASRRTSSRYADLEQRDREIKNSAALRKSLYDYDVEAAVIAYLADAAVGAAPPA